MERTSREGHVDKSKLIVKLYNPGNLEFYNVAMKMIKTATI